MPSPEPRPFAGFPHVLKSQQFEPQDLALLFERADTIRRHPTMHHGTMTGVRAAVLFAEPSSRTFTSFVEAAERLGATVRANQHMALFSSEAKGEVVEDTIRMFKSYGYDYFMLRRSKEGEVDSAALAAGDRHPVINCGDGSGQHPTQALLDLYTIWRHFRDLDRPLTVMLLGDLKNGRTVHSLVYLLAKYPNVRFVFVGPERCTMKADLLEHLTEHGRQFHVVPETHILERPLFAWVSDVDVLYVTRPQLERETETDRTGLVQAYQEFVVTSRVAEAMPSDSIIMHPLPRTFELPETVDTNRRAKYFEQMENGLWIRMALLHWIHDLRTTS